MWVSVDEKVDEKSADDAFWTALAEQLGYPSQEAEAPLIDPGAGMRAEAARRATHLDMPVTVVVDRFDALGRDSVEDLFRLVSANHSLSLVLSARSHPPSMLTSGVGTAVVLTGPDLAFDAEETRRLAAALGAPIADATATTLTAEAEGWPLAIRIALQQATDGTASSWREKGETVAEAQRALLALVHHHPGFPDLVRASVAEAVSPAVATALGLRSDYVEVLEEAADHALGWWGDLDGERSFRLHPVIRAALQKRLTPHERADAYGAYAKWLLESDRVGEAFAAAVEAENWERARYFAYAAFPDVTAHLSRHPRIIAKLPSSVIRADPMLGFLSALSHYTLGHTARALSALSGAFATTQRRRVMAPGRISPERVWAQGLLTAALRLSGRYEFVETALRRFETMLETAHDPESLLAPAAGLFANEAAVTELYLGNLDEARDALARAPHRPHRTKKQHYYADALNTQILTSQGRFAEARRAAEQLRADGLPVGFDESFYGIPLMLATAALHREDGSPARAAAALHQTEAHWSTTENWPLLLAGHVETAWHQHDPLSALETFELRKAEQHRRARISPALADLLRSTHAQLLAAAGRTKEARQLIGTHPQRPALAVAHAQIRLIEGRLPAVDAAEAALSTVGYTPLMRVDLLVIATAAALRSGDPAAATRPFRHAVALAMRHGMRTPFARLAVEERRVLLKQIDADAPSSAAVLARSPLFPDDAGMPRLTKRETVALHDVVRGLSVLASAERHRVSENTIKAQRRSLYRKLGASSASQAVARARELGLL